MTDTSLEAVFGKSFQILKLFLMEPENEINLASAVDRLQMNKMILQIRNVDVLKRNIFEEFPKVKLSMLYIC